MWRVFATLVASLLLAPHAFAATTQRTFVSSAGVDGPVCSLTTPCRSFDAAIAATSSAGEIVVLDAAGYGPVSIAKAVSIIASPGLYAGISVFGGSGVTVNAPGATVVLRGLAINGQGGGMGIELQDAARLRIENCQVAGMSLYGIVATGGSEMIVTDTTLRDNAGAGIRVSPSVNDISVLLERVRSEHNGSQGLYVTPGVAVGTTHAVVSVSESTFADNGADGVYIGNASNGDVSFHLVRSNASHNGGNGVQLENASTGARTSATLIENEIDDNGARGVFESGTGSDGSMFATLDRNRINRNGNTGLALSATNLVAAATLSDNIVSNNGVDGIALAGDVVAFATVNKAIGNNGFDLRCGSGAEFDTAGDNFMPSIEAVGCVITKNVPF